MNKLDYPKMQTAMRDSLEALGPNLMITHNFGGIFKPQTAISRMGWFYSAVQAQLFGRDWAAQFDRPWPIAYGFLEHPNSNPHYHVLARVCPPLRTAIWNAGEELWRKKVPRGQLDVRLIAPGNKARIIYCTKHLTHAGAFDDMFVYSDTRSR
jgi:hypothetical protein